MGSRRDPALSSQAGDADLTSSPTKGPTLKASPGPTQCLPPNSGPLGAGLPRVDGGAHDSDPVDDSQESDMGTRARSDALGATRVHLGTRVPLHATPARAWLPVPPGLSRCGTANGAAGEEGPAARPRGFYPGAQGWRNFRGRQRDARVAEERTTPAWAPPEADGGWAAPRNRLGRGGRVRGRAHDVPARTPRGSGAGSTAARTPGGPWSPLSYRGGAPGMARGHRITPR